MQRVAGGQLIYQLKNNKELIIQAVIFLIITEH